MLTNAVDLFVSSISFFPLHFSIYLQNKKKKMLHVAAAILSVVLCSPRTNTSLKFEFGWFSQFPRQEQNKRTLDRPPCPHGCCILQPRLHFSDDNLLDDS